MVFAYRKRFLILLIAIGLVPFWLSQAWLKFTFLTDRREMLPPEMSAHQTWVRFCQDFDYRSDFMVLAFNSELGMGSSRRAPAAQEAQEAVQLLGQRLTRDPLFEQVFFKIDAPSLTDSALYYVSTAQLSQIESLLRAARSWILDLAKPNGLLLLVERLGSTPAPNLGQQIKPLLDTLVRVLEALVRNIETRGQEPYESPFSEYQPEAEGLINRNVRPGQREFFYTLADGKTYVVMAQASRTKDSPGRILPQDYSTHLTALRALREHLSEVKKSHPSVDFFVTGEAAVETEEVNNALHDAARCGLLGIFLLTLITLTVVHCPRALACILLSNLVTAAWLAGIDAVLGPLNILTAQHWLTAGVVSLWWSFHTVLRFLLQLRSRGCAEGAWTAAGGSWAPEAKLFLFAATLLWVSLDLVGGPPLASLGKYCLLSLVLVSLETGFLLPALIAVAYHHRPESNTSGRSFFLPTRMLNSALFLGQRQGLTRVLQALCLLTLLGLPRVTLDSNLLDLPPLGMSVKQVEAYLQPINYSTLYAFSVAENRDEAMKMRRNFLKLKSVGRCESINLLFPPGVEEKKEQVDRIIALAQSLPLPAPVEPRGASELLDLNGAFTQAQDRLDKALLPLVKSPDAITRAQAQRLRAALEKARGRIDVNNPGPVEAGLFRYEGSLLEDVRFLLDLLHHQQKNPPDVLEQLPASLKVRTVSPTGKILMRIYPREDCWNYHALADFVTDLRQVDPNVTGTPALLFDFFYEIKHGLRRGLLLFSGLGAVLAVVVALKRRLVSPPANPHPCKVRLAAAAPRLGFPVLSGMFSLGLAGLIGLELNALNLWLWLLSIHLGWLYSLALAAANEETSCEPVALACSFLVVALCFLSASHEGMKSCGVMFSMGIAVQILTSFAWPHFYWLCGFRDPED